MDQHGPQLRIAMLLPNLQIGGSQEVVRLLAKHLAGGRCTPVVCAIHRGGPLEAELRAQGTPVEVLHLRRRSILTPSSFLLDVVRLWQALTRVFRQYDINVVQTNNLGALDFLVLALAHRLGISAVTFNFHSQQFLPNLREDSLQNRLHRLVYRPARRWVGDYVAVSGQVKESMLRLLGIADHDVTVICNGVDVERYCQPVDRSLVRRTLGLSDNARLLTTVGRLDVPKGHRYLIDAARVVAERHPDAHFLFVGDGPLRAELEAQTAACGLSAQIHFVGSRRDVSELLAASDVFVLSSLWEGLSVALLEAMAAGLPIVATDVSGTRQLIENGRTGLLIPPRNSADLAGAIDATLSGLLGQDAENGIRRMGEAARRRVIEEFSVQRQAADYLTLYDRLVRCGTRRSARSEVSSPDA